MKLSSSTRAIIGGLCGIPLIGVMWSLVTVDHWSVLWVCLFTAGSLLPAAAVRLLVMVTAFHPRALMIMSLLNAVGGVLPSSEGMRILRIPLLLGILVLLWDPPARLKRWSDRLRTRLWGWRIQGVMGTRY